MEKTIIQKTNNINKKGIAMLPLIITIIVMIILTSVAVAGVNSFINNGKKINFATDLKNIQEAVDIYYNDEGSLPFTVDTKSYTLTTLKTLSGEGAIEIEQEIVDNEDNLINTIFYEIDINKLNIQKGIRGTKKGGVSNDIFVVSSNNMMVYYVKGEKIAGKSYFSLTDILSNSTNIKRENIDTGNISIVVETEGIKITKNKKNWTNSLSIKVETNLEIGESASYTIAGVTPSNAIEIIEGVTIIPLSTATILGADATNFNSADDQDKNIIIEKVKDGITVAKATMSISNLDLEIIEVPEPIVKSYDKSNLLSFDNALDEGDIKEIRYEYITKLNGLSQIENYHNPEIIIDETYMLNDSKKEVGKNISIPKNIKSLVVSFVDKAGNISGYSTITLDNNILKAEAKIDNKNGILLSKELLKNTTGIINKNEGTVEAWVYVKLNMRDEPYEKTIFSTYADEKYTNTIVLRHNRFNKWQAIISSDLNNISDISIEDNISEGWHLFTVRWSSQRFSLFVDGQELAYTIAPSLMSSVPTKFYIGSGPRLNLVKNGYANLGGSTNFPNLTYLNTDCFSEPGCFQRTGPITMLTAEYIPIDTSSVYTQSGSFKSVGAGGDSKTYYGVYTHGKDKEIISSKMTKHYISTETFLTSPLNAGDTIVYVNSVSNWKNNTWSASLRHIGIYNYKNYQPYTMAYYTYAYSDIDLATNTITLTAAYSGDTLPVGTKVANNYDALGSYTYSTMSAVNVPNVWTIYTSNMSGSTINDNVYRQFRYGTKYIRIMMLLNYTGNNTHSTLIDDIEFIDNTKTVFNSNLREVAISNIARTDNDILQRYKLGTLIKDNNVKYMLTDK